MTPDERAKAVNWSNITGKTETVAGIASAIRVAVLEERQACAKIVLDGGDGVDRMETAIRLGGNAAIAEAILARGECE